VNKEEKEIIILAKNGDKEAIEYLCNQNLNLIRNIAKSYTKYCGSFEDLVQEGCVGVLNAISKFDLNKDCKFVTYATYCIKERISNYLYRNRLIRLPKHQYSNLCKYMNLKSKLEKEFNYSPSFEQLAKELNISVEKVMELECNRVDTVSFNSTINENGTYENIISDRSKDIESSVIDKDMVLKLYELINKCQLKPRDIAILNLRYGLDGGKPMSCDKIGPLFRMISFPYLPNSHFCSGTRGTISPPKI